MFGKCQSRQSICEEVWYRTMVIYWSRFRKEVVFYGREQHPRSLGSCSGRNVVGIRRKRTSFFPCNDSIVQEWAQKQRTRKTVDSFCCRQETIETIFRIIVVANQLSFYGAVANMCVECESLHDRSEQFDMVMGQSIVLSEIKTEVSLENDGWPRISELSISAIWRANWRFFTDRQSE